MVELFLLGILVLAIISNLVYYIIITYKWPGGKSIRSFMRELENDTHCGVYWGVKAKWSIFGTRKIVYIHMPGNEYVYIDLITGERFRYNED